MIGDSGTQTSGEPVACVELDRFCVGCGYNLRTLPVRRDLYTGIPIVRCTECGRFQSAGDASTAFRPGLDRLTGSALGAWVLLVVAVLAHLCLAEGAVSYSNLDELTEHAGSNVRRIGTTTFRDRVDTSAPLEIYTDFPEYVFVVGSFLFLSFMIALACGMFAVISMPHWRRAAYGGVMLAMPFIAAFVVAVMWRYEVPHLFVWGVQYIATHAGVQVIGGLVGMVLGRPFARLLVRIILPPAVRPALAYLWFADDQRLEAGNEKLEVNPHGRSSL